MGSMRLDLGRPISSPPRTDDFDRIPDSILLLIFNKIGDVKALGRCCVVSRRFHSLVPLVETVVVRVDCVLSDDDASYASSALASDKSCHLVASLFKFFVSGLIKPLQSLSQIVSPNCRRVQAFDDRENVVSSVTHHSPTQVLKNFNELRMLQIELPGGELNVGEGILLKWKAGFGSTLDNCVILGASSVVHRANTNANANNNNCCSDVTVCGGNNINNNNIENDNGSIPESFYTNGGLKLRVVWTISSLIAASGRHYLLQTIISEHKTLESLVLTDADGQGVLSMNKAQLEELRVKPLSASSASKRTLVPSLNMRLWYAANLELPNGMVLKGATLVAVRPSERKETTEGNWVASAFEEPFGTAARMLVKRRTYCLEMNSF